MRCPFCKAPRTKVVDSREVRAGEEIRRRRLCETGDGGCGQRFTTFERVERRLPMVVKKDGSRVLFERDKVRNGVLRATMKRPISDDTIELFLNDLERRLSEKFGKEVSTREIATQVLEFLRETDHVAFIRFESVYGDFQSIDEFKELVSSLSGDTE